MNDNNLLGNEIYKMETPDFDVYSKDFEINSLKYKAQVISSKPSINFKESEKKCFIYEYITKTKFNVKEMNCIMEYPIDFIKRNFKMSDRNKFYEDVIDDAIRSFKESKVAPTINDTELYIIKMTEKYNNQGVYEITDMDCITAKHIEHPDPSKIFVHDENETYALSYCNLSEKVLGLRRGNDYNTRYFVGESMREAYISFEKYCQSRMEKYSEVMNISNENYENYFHAVQEGGEKWKKDMNKYLHTCSFKLNINQ